jgi:hypothetical protein
MAYCGPRGIAHDVFKSWPQHSQSAALWWARHDAERCRSCGTRPSDFADDPHAFEAVPVHCRGCEISAQGNEMLERDRKAYRRGTSMELKPTRRN